MITIKLKKEIAEFIENSGEYCIDDEYKFIHYPFWLKKTEDPEVFEMYEGEELPRWIKTELDAYGQLRKQDE